MSLKSNQAKVYRVVEVDRGDLNPHSSGDVTRNSPFFLFRPCPSLIDLLLHFPNILNQHFSVKAKIWFSVVGEELIETIVFLQVSHLLVLMAKDFQNRKR
jgi:hypothetical protein